MKFFFNHCICISHRQDAYLSALCVPFMCLTASWVSIVLGSEDMHIRDIECISMSSVFLSKFSKIKLVTIIKQLKLTVLYKNQSQY